MVQKRDIVFEIILELLTGQNHVRGISKQLNEPHATVARKLQILTKENVVDFRNEGKNKVYFLKNNLMSKSYIHTAEKYKLIKLMKTYPQMQVILDSVLSETNEKLVLLFGSYAKFTAKKGSDIDIYVETRDPSVKKTLETLNSKINVKIGPFDTNSPLIREIIKYHIILRGADELYQRFEVFKQT